MIALTGKKGSKKHFTEDQASVDETFKDWPSKSQLRTLHGNGQMQTQRKFLHLSFTFGDLK